MNAIVNVLSFCIFLLALPLVFIGYVFFFFLGLIVYAVAKVSFREQIYRPDNFDVLASLGSELSPSYYNVVFSLEGESANIDKIRKHYYERIFNSRNERQQEISRKWSSILVKFWGYFFWKICPDFNISNHIKLVPREDLVGPDSSGMSYESLITKLTSAYGPSEIEGNMPKWQLIIVPENDIRYMCLFKVHHSISDGLHFNRLMKEVVADNYIRQDRPPLPNDTLWNRLCLVIRSFSLLPYGIWVSAFNKDKNPLHGPKLSGQKNYHVSKPLDVERIRKMKQKTGATVNDVCVSCISKAITCHFQARKTIVPSVTSLLPISSHIHEENLKMKNNISLSSVQLPTNDLQMSSIPNSSVFAQTLQIPEENLGRLPALKRLMVVKGNLEVAKKNPLMMSLGWFMMTVSSKIPQGLSQKLLFIDGLTLNISNINGVRGNSSIAGDYLKDGAFFLNDKDPLGLAVSISSCCGILRFGLTADTGLLSHAEGQVFMDHIHEEMTALEDELVNLQTKKDCNISIPMPM